MSDVTRILSQIESGDPSAAEQLLPLVYDQLRKLSATKLARQLKCMDFAVTLVAVRRHVAATKVQRTSELGSGTGEMR